MSSRRNKHTWLRLDLRQVLLTLGQFSGKELLSVTANRQIQLIRENSNSSLLVYVCQSDLDARCFMCVWAVDMHLGYGLEIPAEPPVMFTTFDQCHRWASSP